MPFRARLISTCQQTLLEINRTEDEHVRRSNKILRKISRLEINLFTKVISPWLSFSLLKGKFFFSFFSSLSFRQVMLLYVLSESSYSP